MSRTNSVFGTISNEEQERLEKLFKDTVHAFGQNLAEPVLAALRRQISGVAEDTARDWVEIARETLSGLIGRTPLSRLQRRSAEDATARTLSLEIFSRLHSLEEADLHREVEVSAREIAELVLSRWFSLLNRQTVPGPEGLVLNAHLLPNVMDVATALGNADFSLYGLEHVEIDKAFHAWLDSTFVEYAHRREAVQFGRRIWVVPDPQTHGMSYRMFSAASAAAAFIRHVQMPVWTDYEAPSRYMIAVERTANVLWPQPSYPMPGDDMRLALLACCMHWRDEDDPLLPLLGSRGGVALSNLFAESLERGVATLRRSLGNPDDELDLLKADTDLLHSHLAIFMQEPDFSTHMIKYMFTSCVAVAATATPRVSRMSESPHSASAALHYMIDSLTHDLHINRQKASKLATLALPGVSRLVGPLAS